VWSSLAWASVNELKLLWNDTGSTVLAEDKMMCSQMLFDWMIEECDELAEEEDFISML